MPNPPDYDVAVVGYGPTGAVAAAALGAAGWRVLVVERETAVHPLPRAIHFDGEVMRLFQRLGVAGALAPLVGTADAYRFVDGAGRVLVGIDRSRDRQPEGWPPLYLFRQPELEAVLRTHVETVPTVTVRLGATAEALRQDADGVTLDVRDAAGRRPVRARYVLGCDGARSRIRDALGIALRPPRPLPHSVRTEGTWLVVDARLTGTVDLPEALHQICDPAGPTTYLPGPGDTRRWEFLLRDDEVPEAVAPEPVRRRLAAHVDPDAVEVERAAVYTFRALVADRWRAGRVLLLGDAAHLMPPFAGQGLGSGVRDAVDAAWKLDLVLRDAAHPALLDTVERERRPHVVALTWLALVAGQVLMLRRPRLAALRDGLFRTARRIGLPLDSLNVPMPPLRSGFARGGGGRLPQPHVRLDGRPVRLDEALGPDFALLGWRCDPREHAGCGVWERVGARPVRVMPAGEAAVPTPGLVTVDDAGGALAAWFRQRGTAAVAIRPDRVVFADLERGRADAALTAYLRGRRMPQRAGRRAALAFVFGVVLGAWHARSKAARS